MRFGLILSTGNGLVRGKSAAFAGNRSVRAAARLRCPRPTQPWLFRVTLRHCLFSFLNLRRLKLVHPELGSVDQVSSLSQGLDEVCIALPRSTHSTLLLPHCNYVHLPPTHQSLALHTPGAFLFQSRWTHTDLCRPCPPTTRLFPPLRVLWNSVTFHPYLSVDPAHSLHILMAVIFLLSTHCRICLLICSLSAGCEQLTSCLCAKPAADDRRLPQALLHLTCWKWASVWNWNSPSWVNWPGQSVSLRDPPVSQALKSGFLCEFWGSKHVPSCLVHRGISAARSLDHCKS